MLFRSISYHRSYQFTASQYKVADTDLTRDEVVAALVLVIVAVIAAVIFVQQAERRIPVNYAKKVVGRKMYGGQNTHIPIKVAMAGVMPIIFAMSFMMFPSMIISLCTKGNPTGVWSVINNVFSVNSSSAWYCCQRQRG